MENSARAVKQREASIMLPVKTERQDGVRRLRFRGVALFVVSRVLSPREPGMLSMQQRDFLGWIACLSVWK